MHPDRCRLPFRPPLASGVLEVADQFLLLRVDGDDGLRGPLEPPDLLVDIPELRVAVRMGCSFTSLPIGLQTVARHRQQFGHQLPADLMAHALQTRRQVSDAFRGPAQRRHRIARGGRLHEPLEIGQEGRIFVERLLAATARTPDPAWRELPFRLQLLKPALNRGSGDSRRARHPGDATPSRGPSLCGRPNPPRALRQRRSQGFELRPAESDIHASSLLAMIPNSCSYSLTTPKRRPGQAARRGGDDVIDFRIRPNRLDNPPAPPQTLRTGCLARTLDLVTNGSGTKRRTNT